MSMNPGEQGDGSGTWSSLNPVQRAMARRMAETALIPVAAMWLDIDAEPALRRVDEMKKAGLPATFTALAVHAVAQTLIDFAELAAEYDYEQFRRRIPATFGIGVATAAPRGLYVPVVHHAERLSREEVAIELNRVVTAVRQGAVSSDLIRGGCFTVTNIGAMGVHGGVPLPNSPQNAILGIASVRAQAVVRNGTVQPGLTTSLTLSIDHRGVDGVTAARFLTTLGRRLQETDSPIEV